MYFICHPPRLIGKGQWGIWRVTATYQDGRTHFADYEGFTSCEVMRRYMMEFGAIHGGTLHAEIIQKKGLDKLINL